MKKVYPRAEAHEISFKIHEEIAPYVEKFSLVGSLGRMESHVADIDILVIPKEGHISTIQAALSSMGDWKKGGKRAMTVEHILGSPFQLDLFLCHPPAQWGILTAVRLNPIPLVIYGKQVLDDMGLVRGGGDLHDAMGGRMRVEHEFDWFDLVGIPYVAAEDRWELTRRLRLI